MTGMLYRLLKVLSVGALVVMFDALSCHAAAEGVNQGEPQIEGGQEAEITMPDNGRMMKVYLPLNYSRDRKWPVIFFFHGMHGKPTTSPIKEYTEGADFVIIGMPYAAEDEVPKTPQEAEGILQKELANFRSARLWAGRRLQIDEKRVFMGGISLGGWETSTLGEYEQPRLAGMFILLAGRQRVKTQPKEAAALSLKPIYIGSGESDPNLLPALKAVAAYRRYGAAVTYEIYMGTGHAMPQATQPRFKAWLDAMGRWRAEDMTIESRKELDEKIKTQLDKAMAENEPLARYNALMDLEADPALPLCSPALAEDVHGKARTACRESPGKEAALTEKTFLELAWQDTGMKTIHDLKVVRDGARKLASAYPGTFFGNFAAKYSDALAQMYQKSLESVPGNQTTASKPGTVNFPTSGDGRVRPPPVKYRKP